MPSPSLQFFGAAECVTGAAMLLKTDRAAVLIDCGLFQGPKTLKALNYAPFPFNVSGLDAVLLTHAHIDHSGLLPKLALAGFKGPIHATAGTIELCRVMLPDAGAIQEMEVEALNRRNLRRGEPTVDPIYTKADAEACLRLFKPAGLKSWIDVAPGVRARWWSAGHILGAASIEVEIEDGETPQRLLFSGDIGPGGSDFVEGPEAPTGFDHVILESTYGDIERAPRSSEERRRILADELRAAHAAGGPVLIPAFAVERTQELIVDLLELMERNEAPPAPIFLDSPLAIRASQVFLRDTFSDGRRAFARLRESTWLKFTESVAESRAIERVRGWHVIIAASGMCDAGRVRHHLKRLLWREDATVLICGYQAVGTLGRLLQEGRKVVRIQGDEVKVRARIRSIDVYSGHADAAALTRWAAARKPIAGSIYLMHGEPPNLEGLQRRLVKDGAKPERVIVAELDQSYRLKRGRAGERGGAVKPRIPRAAASRLDWHNARAELISLLRTALDAAPDDAAREAILKDLHARLAVARAPDAQAVPAAE